MESHICKSIFKNSTINALIIIQGVPTSLGYAKCNVLKLRKVCERSELRLQNIDPLKRGKFQIIERYI